MESKKKHRTLNKQKNHKKECLFVHESLLSKIKKINERKIKKQDKKILDSFLQ